MPCEVGVKWPFPSLVSQGLRPEWSVGVEIFGGATEPFQPDLPPLWPLWPWPLPTYPPRPDSDLISTRFAPERGISGPNHGKGG